VEWTAAAGKIYWYPNNPTLDNFRTIFSKQLNMNAMAETAIRPIINSLIVSVVGTIIAMVAGVLAAYSISRFKVGGSLPFSLLQLRMFPPIAIIIPIMIMWAFLRMIDKWYGLVIIYGVVTLPFATWLMKTFFDDIPNELNEAAVVDGCSNLGAFLKVVFPLARGGIASTGLFVFILNWSDFLIALVLTDRRWTTIPVHISKLQSALVGQLYGPKAALGVIAAVPPIVLGILIQKYLVRGLTFGAIKK
jgi:multiple sugar transport system permease protein